MKKLLLTLLLTVMSVMAGKASVVLNSTNFPDSTFRLYVSEITGVAEGGTISDAKLQVIKSINVESKGIVSLKGVEHFTYLAILNCNYNELTDLDVSKNTALTKLECNDDYLTSLDLSYNTSLTDLSCHDNQLTNLDVTKNIALTSLLCYNNQLSSLDVSKNTALTSLLCYNNQLSSLDVSKNTALTRLECSDNQLYSLDVSYNTALEKLFCSNNQLTNLDVSQNTVLTGLQCHGNLLTTLDVSQNTSLTSLSCGNNQLTTIDVSRNTSLVLLDCQKNLLENLDVSQNTKLEYLYSNYNKLTNLDVSKNIKLYHLDCYDNQLMCLDLQNNRKLSSSVFISSQRISLSAERNGSNQYSIPIPSDFVISQVSQFFVNGVVTVPTVSSGTLVFTSSSTPRGLLYEYHTGNNVVGNMSVYVTITGIIEQVDNYDLNISAYGNGSATYNGINIHSGSQTFSVAEGSDATVTFSPEAGHRIATLKKNGEDVISNLVNNQYTVSNITENTTIAVSFAEESSGVVLNSTNFPDDTFRAYISELTVVAEGGTISDEILLSTNNINITNKDISNLKGIEHFTSLKSLVCFANHLSYLDVSKNTVLETLNFGWNYLTSIDLSKNTSLKELTCYENKLTGLDVSKNILLTSLDCRDNELSELDISQNTQLTELYCGTNHLTSLDLSNNLALTVLSCFGNLLANLDMSSNISLTRLYCSDNQLSCLKVTNNTDLTRLQCSRNHLMCLDLSNCPQIDSNWSEAFSQKVTLDATSMGDNFYSISVPDDFDLSKVSEFKVNDDDVIPSMSNGTLTFSCPSIPQRITYWYRYLGSISRMDVTITISSITYSFTENGITYNILANDNNEVKVVSGFVEGDFVLPETVDYDNTTWTVTAIDDGAFKDCAELKSLEIPATVTTVGNSLFVGCRRLGAVVWNPAIALTEAMLEGVSNPNLLLYVTAKQLAPASIHNVIVNGVADDIILADAIGGNDFHCPKAFTAAAITYSHHYSMTSGIGECQGWETIALPFDVQAISFGSTRLVPFSVWDGGKSSKPFWLYRLFEGQGFIPDGSIRKNVPYIISMPNNDAYDASYNISGVVTFSGFNTTVDATTKMTGPVHNGKMFVPTYGEQESGGTVYALNVNNQLGNHSGAFAEGSVFTSTPSRTVHPFEAFMLVSEAQAKTFFSVFDDLPTMIEQPVLFGRRGEYVIYHLSGQMVRRVENATYNEAVRGLRAGVYLVNGRKIVLK